MLYHNEIRLPFMAQIPLPDDFQDKTLTHLLETNRATSKLIRSNTEESFSQADKYYNRKSALPHFQEGDRAFLYDEYIPSGVMRKLHCFYRPVTIVECLLHFCYKLRDDRSQRLLPFKVHASRLKQFVNGREGALTHVRGTPTVSPRPSPLNRTNTTQQRQLQDTQANQW